ncbi:chlorophyll(ide) b reductase [Marchantia polymorpha subsp. ruderalis]|uniref:chlorophyll(ide) b reductase n=2 Tax=Marchantia polymorpha TaxID=3197 RepID=A0A176VQB9_MARPO|nr:hypothetical protein AXG93_1544s1150 [Marchantia polymorpha subsp. ruderalis]PTQ31137.1 hypothetical protein MARPO_0115s0053 [Marchantia polymorpha]BBN07917.1 hypothetical protein Mp_4g07280 [Marchantia polymorpha subsp. ruderalis]|eukprot:PTQ31137.1 hypothetical protein MARPO_0115s0053 [Marchantia polymorpha]
MAIVGVGNCLGVHVFVSFSRIRGGGREKDAFSSLSELRPLSAQCCTQLPKRLRCGMHQQRVLVRPCASLLVPSGCRSGCRGGKQSLRSSNLDFFSRGKQVHRLSYRKKYLSITSSAAGNEGESADTVEKSESGSLSSVESEENVEGGEPEVVPAENFMFEDQLKIMEADIRVASGTLDGVKKVASSIIRVLSGASWIDNAAAAQKEKKIDLLPKPYRLLDGTDPSPAGPLRKKLADTWRRAESDFMAFSRQLGKYVFITTGTGAVLAAGFELTGGSPHEQGVLWFSWLAGVVVGSMIGAGQVLENHAKAGRRTVVITGSTRGLGKALAREFLRHGDNVVVTSRSAEAVNSTVEELRAEVQEQSGTLSTQEAQMELFGLPRLERPDPRVVGIACDVSKSEDVKALAAFAVEEFGAVNIWINNAGVNKGFRPLLEFSGEELEQIVSTNMLGSMICTREAIKLMKSQPKGGHVFNMDGAGSGGSSTPLTAAYGATKCGLRQLNSSLLEENKGSRVGLHTASPGMVLTDLLLSGASLRNKKMFNFICEQPETVARALVPNMRLVSGTGKAVNYLTPTRIVLAIVTAWIRRGRWFDEEGRAVYAAETERLRMWAEGRERSSVTAAMELVPSGTWVSLFSSSVICAYIIFTSSSNGNMPGT